MDDITHGWSPSSRTSYSTYTGNLGLEDFQSNPPALNPYPWFNPANIVIEKGIYYVTLYTCQILGNVTLLTQLQIWFGSLKETDTVKLTVDSMVTGLPVITYIPLLSAIYRTKATVIMSLDVLVSDELAYFYLIADKLIPGANGGLFIPSYIKQSQEDTSSVIKVLLDFAAVITDEARDKGILTDEDVQKLHDTKPVIVPMSRLLWVNENT